MSTLADRHLLYQHAVQDVEAEIDFVEQTWSELRQRPAIFLREDFCGTANTACEWVIRDDDHQAVGVDLDREVLEWGRLMSYLEQSTRYIAYDSRLGGRYRYYRDPAVLAGPLGTRYVGDLDRIFESAPCVGVSIRHVIPSGSMREDWAGGKRGGAES